MAKRTAAILLLGLPLGACAISLAGCASTADSPKQGVKRTEQTADSLGEVRLEVMAAKKQLEATTAALQTLTSQAGGNRRPNFEAYMRELARLEVQANRAKSRADDLYARADAYIAKWAEEATKVQNPDLKKQAEERRAKVKQN